MPFGTDADLPSSVGLTYKAKQLTTYFADLSKCLSLSEDNNVMYQRVSFATYFAMLKN